MSISVSVISFADFDLGEMPNGSTVAGDLMFTSSVSSSSPWTTDVVSTHAPEEECEYYIFWQNRLSIDLWLYGAPFLILFGIIGNLLTLVVLQSALYRNSPANVALSTLALADIGVLATGLLRQWLVRSAQIDVRALSNGGCKVHIFFTYLFIALSACTLAMTTVERALSVIFPMRIREWVTRRRMATAWGVLAITLALIHIPILFAFHIIESGGQFYCYYISAEWKQWWASTWYWVSFVLQFALPFTVILFGNSIIVFKIAAAASRRARKMNTKDDKKTSSTTVMLLVVATAFMLTITPAQIYFLGLHIWVGDEACFAIAKVHLAYAVVNVVMYTNNAVNFVLYCVSGSRFRKALRSILCGVIGRGPSERSTGAVDSGVSTRMMSVADTEM